MRHLTLPLIALFLGGCSYKLFEQKNPTGTIAPPPPQEFRAVWVATVANIDWPSKPGLPVAQQVAEMNAILDKAVDVNLNAVVLQVRTSCDALYYSDLEPWSEYLTGAQGRAPVPYYDPLAAWVDAAHKRGLELHAWFNPYRARHSGAKTPDAPNHLANTNPDIVKKFNGWEWLDPAEPEAREHTLRVIADVVRRYDIDGVHIDDYFYPYPDYYTDPKTRQKTLNDFPDDPAWDRYQKSGGTLSRADWRRDHVNRMVHDIYATIKATKQHVKFGISPFGIAHPATPETVKSTFDQYNTLYADAKLWLNEGWCDYYTPQIYWKIDSPQPYVDILKWWATQNTQNRHLWPGNFTSRVGTRDTDWPAAEIVGEVNATRANTPDGYPGNVHFSMIAFLQNRGGLNDALKSGPYAQPALVPPTPWLSPTAPGARPGPAAPAIQVTEFPNGTLQLTWDNNDMQDPFRWAVYAKSGDQWKFNTFPSQVRTVAIRPETNQPVSYITVIAVDRLGNPSTPRSIDLSRRTPCCPLKF